MKELTGNTGEINNLPAYTREYNFADEKAKWKAKGYVIEGIAEGKLTVTRKCK